MRVARLGHRDPPQHLADDQLDVLVVDRHALLPVHLLHLVDEVLLGVADALDGEQLLGVLRTLDQRVAGGDLLAVADLEVGPQRDVVGLLGAVVADDGDPAAVLLVGSMRTTPDVRARTAAPLGVRASNSSTTRGRPAVMSPPSAAIPPVWKVRMVSCVPGSPMDWAAMTPTASPISMGRPVASERP